MTEIIQYEHILNHETEKNQSIFPVSYNYTALRKIIINQKYPGSFNWHTSKTQLLKLLVLLYKVSVCFIMSLLSKKHCNKPADYELKKTNWPKNNSLTCAYHYDESERMIFRWSCVGQPVVLTINNIKWNYFLRPLWNLTINDFVLI